MWRFTCAVGLAVSLQAVTGAQASSAPSVWIGQAVAGTQCQTGSPGSYDSLQGAVQAGGPSYAVPTDGRAITSWKMSTGQIGGSVQLEVWRETSTANTYQLVDISGIKHLTSTEHVYTFTLANPLNVSAGDVLGMRQDSPYLDCGTLTGNAGDKWLTNHHGGAAPKVGADEAFSMQANLQLDIAAHVRTKALLPSPSDAMGRV